MKRRAARRALVIALLFVLLSVGRGPATARAQDLMPNTGEGDARVVESIRVEGADAAMVTPYLGVRAGAPLDPDQVRMSLLLLSATDRFDAIDVLWATDGALVVRVRETPRLGRVSFESDRATPLDPALVSGARRAAGFREGELVRPARLEDIASRIRAWLRSQAYDAADVRVSLRDPEHRGGGAIVDVRISRPEREVLTSVRVDGWPRGFAAPPLPSSGAIVTEANRDKWTGALRTALRRGGFLRAVVRVESVRGVLVFFTTPGPRVLVEIKDLPPRDAARWLRSLEARGLDQEAQEDIVAAIESRFRERGHRDVEVDVREEVEGDLTRVRFLARPGPAWTLAGLETEGDGPPMTFSEAGLVPFAPWVDARVEAARVEALRSLALRGHARARISVSARGEPARATLVFQIARGSAYRVDDVAFEGFPAEREEGRVAELVTRRFRPFVETDVARDRATLVSRLRDLGWIDARVEPEAVLDDEKGLARITFRATPGERIAVERIVLSGLERTKGLVVLRESRLKEGEWLSYQGLLDTQTALAGTGLFSNVAVREIAVSERARTLVIEAQEAPLVTIVPALGYSERNKLRASADVSRRNVSGLGRSTALFGRVSIRGWRALASFTEPYAFGRRQAVTFQTFAEDDQRDAFSFRRFGAQAQTLFPLPLSTTLLAQYTFQRTRTRDVQTDCAEIDRDLCDGDISGPTFGLLRDTRNDAIDPRRGSLIQFEVQGSARFVQGDPFLKATASFARYAEVRRGLVIASGIRLGAARAYGGSMQIPVSERFFAGGDSSLRGFETDRLGPLRNNDLGDPIPVGGNALAILSVEARADLTRYFGAQAFLETGGLFARVSDARVSGLRQVAGLGVRYRSPVGPIRVEYAWILDRRVGEDRGQLHVGLGYAF